MRKCLTIIAFTMIALSANAKNAVEIFNGKDLNGWSIFTKEISVIPEETFYVEGKSIEASGDFGYIYTNGQYGNYKLTMEWRWVYEGSNSGIFLNMQGENKAWPSCYEIQLKSGDAGTIFHVGGTDSDEAKAGERNKAKNNAYAEKPVGEWNKAEIINSPSAITVYINDVKQNEIHNISQTRGHIGFQSEGGAIQFRNFKLEPLTNK